MAITKLTEFAVDGEKNSDGLTEVDGFPILEKPARQWFNYLLNNITSKSNEIIDSVDGIILETGIEEAPTYPAQVSRSLFDKNKDMVSVKDFGAVGDGIVNDTTSFQNALNALEGTGRVLYIPDGTYAVSGLDLKGTSLCSSGCKIITDKNPTNRYLLKDSTTNSIRLTNITFDGFGAIQDSSSVWQRCALFEQNDSVTMVDVSYINCKGSLSEFKVSVKSYSITGGRVVGCTDAHGFIVRAQHGFFNSTLFRDCTEHVIRFGRFNNDADVPSGNFNIVSNCSFYNIGNDAILFELNSGHGVISNCVSENCRSFVKVETDAALPENQRGRRVIVDSNICINGINEVSAAIKLNASVESVVTNNLIQGYYEGITVGANSIVSNNIVRGITESAIRVYGNSVNISGNDIKTSKTGINTTGQSYISVVSNRIDTCPTGISITASDNNIFQNRLANNTIGIRLFASATNNIISMNIGRTNTTPISDVGSGTIKQNNFGDLAP